MDRHPLPGSKPGQTPMGSQTPHIQTPTRSVTPQIAATDPKRRQLFSSGGEGTGLMANNPKPPTQTSSRLVTPHTVPPGHTMAASRTHLSPATSQLPQGKVS